MISKQIIPIIYFSASNNTRYVAELIAQGILSQNGTPKLIPVTRAEDYTQELHHANTLCIGAPIYGGEYAAPMHTWIQKTDFTGKNVFLFSTAALMFFGSFQVNKKLIEKNNGTILGCFEMRFIAAGDGFFYNQWFSRRFPLSKKDIGNAYQYGQHIASFTKTKNITFLDYRKKHHAPTLTTFIIKHLLKEPLVSMFVHFLPQYDTKRCINCKKCEHICPTHALSIKESKERPVDPTKCIMCFQCAKQCPTQALYLTQNKRFSYYQGPWQLNGYIPPENVYAQLTKNNKYFMVLSQVISRIF